MPASQVILIKLKSLPEILIGKAFRTLYQKNRNSQHKFRILKHSEKIGTKFANKKLSLLESVNYFLEFF
jgi:hypothetical protein